MSEFAGRLLKTFRSAWSRLTGRFKPKRVALAIGNSRYDRKPLSSPSLDVDGIAAALASLGFTVKTDKDVNSSQLNQLIDDFRAAANKADVALFYYSGHAFQVNGDNYLVPIGVERQADAGLLVDVNRVFAPFAKAATTLLVILDACRNNPYAAALGGAVAAAKGFAEPIAIETGLADVRVERNAYIAYAAAPGKEAYEGEPGKRSPFTRCMLRHVKTPGLELDELMRRVRLEVKELTRGTQNPFSNSGLIGEFFFRRWSPYPIYVMGVLGIIGAIAAVVGIPALESVWKTPVSSSGYWMPGLLLGVLTAYAVKTWDQHGLNFVAAFFVAVIAWSGAFYVQDMATDSTGKILGLPALKDASTELKRLDEEKFEKQRLLDQLPWAANLSAREKSDYGYHYKKDIDDYVLAIGNQENTHPFIREKLQLNAAIALVLLGTMASVFFGISQAATSTIFRSVTSVAVLFFCGSLAGVYVAITQTNWDQFSRLISVYLATIAVGLGYLAARFVPQSTYVERPFLYRPDSYRPIVSLMLLGMFTGVISSLLPHAFDNTTTPSDASAGEILRYAFARLQQGYVFRVNIWHGVVFGLVVAVGLLIWGDKKPSSLMFVFLVLLVIVSWVLAVRVASLLIGEPDIYTIGFVPGAIGAGGTLVACALVKKSMWQPGLWALTLMTGAIATLPDLWIDDGCKGGLPCGDEYRPYLDQLVLYVPWQACVAGCVGYGLALPEPELPMD